MQEEFSITLDLQRDYQFAVDFGLEGVPPLVTDEPPPLGEAAGPNPVRVLAAAVGNCMSASLKFCLSRSRIEVLDIKTVVEGTMVRNERGRFRVGSMRVRIEPVVGPDDVERMARCLEMFEDFCIVGQSVRDGIDIAVEVAPNSAAVAGGTGGATPGVDAVDAVGRGTP
ncbi:MAG TPA: OsmC family protein [Longimicrobiales bacterium]|nr:OsmC family protein [Longimicrobiales bacterium]